MTLVSVVTPTWQRHDLLLTRCIPSVAAQEYLDVEHVIASDGPDPALAEQLAPLEAMPGLRFVQVPWHNRVMDWGVGARLAALKQAKGEIIAYLDDDNAYRPNHLSRLVKALEDTGVDFVYSRMRRYWPDGAQDLIGNSPPAYGQIDTSIICHRASLLERATWAWSPWIAREMADPHAVDWHLVQRWLAAGASWAFVPAVTVDYYVAA